MTRIVVFKGHLGFNWIRQGDEWRHHLHNALAEHVKVEGWTECLRPPGAESDLLVVFNPKSPDLKTSLEISIEPTHEALIEVVCEGDPPRTDIGAWGRAVTVARRRLGEEHPVWPWQAILMPGSGVLSGTPPILLSDATVGPLEVIRMGTSHQQTIPTRELHQSRVLSWWPILVKGCSRGIDRMAGQRTAVPTVHRLCALLSLSWDTEMLPSVGPTVVRDRDLRLESTEVGNVAKLEVEVPSWASSAWAKLEAQPRLDIALGAFYEGVRLHSDHPSFALIAFLGTIEGIAEALDGLAKRSSCVTCGREFGAGKRVRQALSLVMGTEEAKQLADRAYPPRSKTAHQGATLGLERWFGLSGWAGMGIFETLAGGPLLFPFNDVGAVRQAARKLLTAVLSDQLPPTT